MQTAPKLFICEALGCICHRFLLTKYGGGEVDVGMKKVGRVRMYPFRLKLMEYY